MRRRVHKKKSRLGGIALILLLAVTAARGYSTLLPDKQQPELPTTKLTELKAIPIKTESFTIIPEREETRTVMTTGEETGFSEPIENKMISGLSINSSSAVLIKAADGEVLFEKNSTERIFPASITKIMTAVIVLENMEDLNQKVLLSKEVFNYTSQASVAGFLQDEEVRAIDLLYGLLLPSGAECAIGLAEFVAGSESAFVDLMNDKARELGMNDTHYVNTTGLHDDNHYSTVEDITVLLRYAIENDTFFEIFTSDRHPTPPTNKHKDGITYYSTLFSNMDGADFKGGVILGGKTGYTTEAGQCLASLAEVNGERYILVTCGAHGDNKTQILHIDDALTVYNMLAMAN